MTHEVCGHPWRFHVAERGGGVRCPTEDEARVASDKESVVDFTNATEAQMAALWDPKKTGQGLPTWSVRIVRKTTPPPRVGVLLEFSDEEVLQTWLDEFFLWPRKIKVSDIPTEETP